MHVAEMGLHKACPMAGVRHNARGFSAQCWEDTKAFNKQTFTLTYGAHRATIMAHKQRGSCSRSNANAEVLKAHQRCKRARFYWAYEREATCQSLCIATLWFLWVYATSISLTSWGKFAWRWPAANQFVSWWHALVRDMLPWRMGMVSKNKRTSMLCPPWCCLAVTPRFELALCLCDAYS